MAGSGLKRREPRRLARGGFTRRMGAREGYRNSVKTRSLGESSGSLRKQARGRTGGCVHLPL